jgi:drug/metabolite transporter (DMT)-like permease
MSNINKTDRTLTNRPFVGVLLMILGLALYPLSDAFVKHLMSCYSLQQISLLRATTRLVPLCIAMFFSGGPKQILATRHVSLHLIRLAVSLAYTYTFIYSFSLTSLTNVYTLSYTSAFFMTLLSAYILKEKVTRKRWLAVALGMVGVLIALNPTAKTFDYASIVILFGTVLGALNKILMRKLAATEHSLAIAIYPNIMMVIVTAPFLVSSWKSMPFEHWGLFAFVGALTALGQYSIAQALRFTQASILAPIDYSTFFWVFLLDYFWWQLSPNIFTLVGAGVIVASNFYIISLSRHKETGKETS